MIAPHVHRQLSQSASDFQAKVWPVVAAHPALGGGELQPVEVTTQGEFSGDLDRLAGIDAWQIMRAQSAIRGLASRVQWGNNYRNFTVRFTRGSGRDTEFSKRLEAISNKDAGYLFPHWTIQAFLDRRNGNLLSAAAIRTEPLILQLQRLLSYGKLERDGDKRFGRRTLEDGTTFLYVSWEYLQHTAVGDELHVFNDVA